MTDDNTAQSAIELAAELTIAWLSNPNTRVQSAEVPEFLRIMHDAVTGLAGSSERSASEAQSESGESFEPAVSVRKSLASRDHIISLIDGKPYKTLRRHLSGHNLSPQEYRQRYGLKPDYPMVAPAYAEQRRELAKKIGLGRKPGEKAPQKSAARSGRSRRKPAASAE